MEWKMNLEDKYLQMVLEGTKTIEIRCNDEKRQLLNEGDILVFGDIKVKIASLQKYKTFKETFDHIDFKLALPNCKTKEEAVKEYLGISDFEEKQNKYGVLLIKIHKN